MTESTQNQAREHNRRFWRHFDPASVDIRRAEQLGRQLQPRCSSLHHGAPARRPRCEHLNTRAIKLT